jgi:hypothetical protein
MKLTKEDIQFIDTYLENSDIVFADIRMEMVDHVAFGIEAQIEAGDTRDFYEVFKDYMIENKARLLRDNKQFIKSADKKILTELLKELQNPITPLMFAAACVGFYQLYRNLSFGTFKNYVSIVPLLGLIGFLLIYVVYSKLKQLRRFSSVERLAWPFFIVYQMSVIILNLSDRIKDESSIFWIIGGLSFALTLISLLIQVSLKLYKSYERRFGVLL